jgi:hypothetical protein
MRTLILASLAVLTFACASGGNDTDANLTRPEVQIAQINGLPAAARHISGGVSINYAVRVRNRADQPITLKRVSVQSMNEGAYNVAPTSRPFDVKINAEQFQDVEFWVSAQTGRSLVGANGPVTLRVTCEFDSPAGRFQEIVIRTVNQRTSINGEQ